MKTKALPPSPVLWSWRTARVSCTPPSDRCCCTLQKESHMSHSQQNSLFYVLGFFRNIDNQHSIENLRAAEASYSLFSKRLCGNTWGWRPCLHDAGRWLSSLAAMSSGANTSGEIVASVCVEALRFLLHYLCCALAAAQHQWLQTGPGWLRSSEGRRSITLSWQSLSTHSLVQRVKVTLWFFCLVFVPFCCPALKE